MHFLMELLLIFKKIVIYFVNLCVKCDKTVVYRAFERMSPPRRREVLSDVGSELSVVLSDKSLWTSHGYCILYVTLNLTGCASELLCVTQTRRKNTVSV